MQELGLTDVEALDFNLAPLPMRRDVAMMGLLYKVFRGVAPKAIQKLFSLNPCSLHTFGFAPSASRHKYEIHDPVEVGHPAIIRRSIFGLIRIFNQLN